MITLTLSSVGSTVSDPLEVYTNQDGGWTYFASVYKATLLSGYTFEPPLGTTGCLIRDTGECGTSLTLLLPGVTTTTSTSTTSAGVYRIEPDHLLSTAEGGTLTCNLVMPAYVPLTVTPDSPWVTASIAPGWYIYSTDPALYYEILSVTFEANLDIERLGEVRLTRSDTGDLFGVVALRQEGVIT